MRESGWWKGTLILSGEWAVVSLLGYLKIKGFGSTVRNKKI